MTARLSLLAALFAIACSSSSNPSSHPDASKPDAAEDAVQDVASETGGAGGAAGSDAGSDAASDADASAPADITIAFPSFVVPSGQSATKCVELRLGNVATHVASIHDVLSAGVFRFLVYAVNDSVEQPTPTDCQPLGGVTTGDASALILSVQADDTLSLPNDVAFAVDANQMIRLELQAYNPGSSDQTVSAGATFGFTASASHNAGLLFLLENSISVAPGSSDTGSVDIFTDLSLTSASYFSFIGYTGRHGTDTSLAIGTGSGTDNTIYSPSSYDYSAPPRVTLGTPIQLASGQLFILSCSWLNQGTSALSFGLSPADEICLAGAYYYEDVGPKLCTSMACCPGASGC